MIERVSALLLLILLAPILFLIALIIKLTSKGPIIHWSKRNGINNKLFQMPKFRTMENNTPQLATHLMPKEKSYLTSVGRILRKTSLDELPQLWSIIKGDMSFIGPRPALFNQYDLISLRTQKEIHLMRPGITGWAQVNGRDDISIKKKVELEHEYLVNRCLMMNIQILMLTLLKTLKRENISS